MSLATVNTARAERKDDDEKIKSTTAFRAFANARAKRAIEQAGGPRAL